MAGKAKKKRGAKTRAGEGKGNRANRAFSFLRSDTTNEQRQVFNSKPFTEFAKWVEDNRVRDECHSASRHDRSDRHYVTLEALREYWTPEKIDAIRRAYTIPLSFGTDTIRYGGYLRTFSTLVYASIVGEINQFINHGLNDERLPLQKYPKDAWVKYPHMQGVFDKVFEKQWTFFPLIFKRYTFEDLHLHDNHRLPIRIVDELNRGDDGTCVSKIMIQEGCNKLGAKNGVFVLKSYRPKSQKQYETEIAALLNCRNSPSSNIITYYGSFRQNKTFSLILEYAEMGSLSDLYTKLLPPTDKADITIFWKSLCAVLGGLDSVHNLKIMPSSRRAHGIHEDIKPDNILICKGATDSDYDFVPKVADFGLFSPVSNSPNCDAVGFNTNGNQIFSSPEASHNALDQRKGSKRIDMLADIFSMGAVLSDACAWLHGGPEFQDKYRKARVAVHANMPNFVKSGYEGCFHDGTARLKIIDEIHKEITDGCKSRQDDITPRVISVIEDFMLLGTPSNRKDASFSLQKLHHAINGTDVSSAESETTEAPTDVASNLPKARRSPDLAELGQRLEIQHFVENYKAGRKAADPKFAADLAKFLDLLKTNVPGRDHFFFIDDSKSMERYRKEVSALLLSLLTVTKHLDPDKLELAFASTVTRKNICRTNKRKKLLNALDGSKPWAREPDVMANCVSRLIHDVIFPWLPYRPGNTFNIIPLARKQTSVYIFTDGKWGKTFHGGGVDRPIKELIEELQRRRLDRHQVTLHFIRFGDDPDGGRNLDYLDSLAETAEDIDEDWDIIDVKPHDSPLHQIIIGPISPENDEIDRDSD